MLWADNHGLCCICRAQYGTFSANTGQRHRAQMYHCALLKLMRRSVFGFQSKSRNTDFSHPLRHHLNTKKKKNQKRTKDQGQEQGRIQLRPVAPANHPVTANTVDFSQWLIVVPKLFRLKQPIPPLLLKSSGGDTVGIVPQEHVGEVRAIMDALKG